MVPSILALAHESPAESAHAGSARLHRRLAERFYWSDMWKDVQQFCRTCDICQKTKPDQRGPNGLLRPHSIPLLPFDVITLDLITSLPQSNGYDSILVIVDKLTKFVRYIPTHSTLKQEGFAKLFLKHVVRDFGLPLEMIADRDARWAKSFWSAVSKQLGLRLSLTTSRHPQGDGQTENANQSLEISLRAYVAGNRHGWSEFLNLLEHAYNTTPHSITGYAPAFLLRGYIPRSELGLLDPVRRGIERSLEPNASADRFLAELEVHRTRARDALAKGQAAQARAYNKGRRPNLILSSLDYSMLSLSLRSMLLKINWPSPSKRLRMV